MGNHLHTYLGPFVVATNPPQPKTVTRTGCINQECKSYHLERSVPFCASCGAATGLWTEDVSQSKVDAPLLAGRISGSLAPAYDGVNADIWLPNRYESPAPREFNIGEGSSVKVLDFGLAGPAHRAEMDWLSMTFAEDIAVLQEVYGADQVRIGWGVVNRWF